ncbi:MAG: hypothetical protein MZV63_16905, partial [Marinilabiliales bacterium]|nr:hypothetical protein [Marinilabiliales bacterium]
MDHGKSTLADRLPEITGTSTVRIQVLKKVVGVPCVNLAIRNRTKHT